MVPQHCKREWHLLFWGSKQAPDTCTTEQLSLPPPYSMGQISLKNNNKRPTKNNINKNQTNNKKPKQKHQTNHTQQNQHHVPAIDNNQNHLTVVIKFRCMRWQNSVPNIQYSLYYPPSSDLMSICNNSSSSYWATCTVSHFIQQLLWGGKEVWQGKIPIYRSLHLSSVMCVIIIHLGGN